MIRTPRTPRSATLAAALFGALAPQVAAAQDAELCAALSAAAGDPAAFEAALAGLPGGDVAGCADVLAPEEFAAVEAALAGRGAETEATGDEAQVEGDAAETAETEPSADAAEAEAIAEEVDETIEETAEEVEAAPEPPAEDAAEETREAAEELAPAEGVAEADEIAEEAEPVPAEPEASADAAEEAPAEGAPATDEGVDVPDADAAEEAATQDAPAADAADDGTADAAEAEAEPAAEEAPATDGTAAEAPTDEAASEDDGAADVEAAEPDAETGEGEPTPAEDAAVEDPSAEDAAIEPVEGEVESPLAEEAQEITEEVEATIEEESQSLLQEPVATQDAEAAAGVEAPQEDTAATAEAANAAPEVASGAIEAARAAAGRDGAVAPEDAPEAETVAVTEENARSATEEAAPRRPAAEADDDELSSFQKALLLGLGAVAVGTVLQGQGEVVQDTGDRVVVRQGDELRVLKDDDALLRRPGAEVSTRTYDDGTTLTTVDREDGSRVITVRAANGQVLRRTVVDPAGNATVLFDDTAEIEAVDVAQLDLTARDRQVEDLRAALGEAPEARVSSRAYSLQQIRQIRAVRQLVPQIEVTQITFDTGSSAIRPDQAEELRDIGEAMRAAIDANPAEVFLVEGHTDAVGPAASNLALSDRRAESVALALTEFFDVPPENMVVQGYGESALKVRTGEAERANRRAAVRRITPLLARGT